MSVCRSSYSVPVFARIASSDSLSIIVRAWFNERITLQPAVSAF